MSYCGQEISSALHFSLKQIAEINAEINSPFGYAIFFGRLEIFLLVFVTKQLTLLTFCNKSENMRKLHVFSGSNDFAG